MLDRTGTPAQNENPRDGGTHGMIDQMQTRAELYATIGLHDYEALDSSIVETVIPKAMPQR